MDCDSYSGDIKITKTSHSALNVLVATPYFPAPVGRGGGMSISNQVNQLLAHGVDVRVVRFVPYVPIPIAWTRRKWHAASQIPKKYTWNGIRVSAERYITFPRNLTHLFAARQIARILTKMIEDTCPDIIHAHHAIPVGIAAVKAGRKLDIPVMLTVHGSDIIRTPYLAKKYYRSVRKALEEATLAVGVSRTMKEEAMAIAPGARAIVHRTGIDISKFTPEKTLSDFTKQDESFDILFLGRLIADKGVHDLLEGFCSFVTRNRGVDAKLIYVGSGPESSRLVARIDSDSNLQGKVRLLGPCNHQMVPSVMRMCDVVVMPSHYEGLGMVAVEACACGKPVIASNVGGLPEVITDGLNGILISPGSYTEIANALEILWANPDLRMRMGRAGRTLAETEYDIQRNTVALLELYETLLNEK